MLKILLASKMHKFHAFTEILGFIQGIAPPSRKQAVAEQAIELLNQSSLDFGLIEYYKGEFSKFLYITSSVKP